MLYSGSRVFIPNGPSSFCSTRSKAFQALSTENNSGACYTNTGDMNYFCFYIFHILTTGKWNATGCVFTYHHHGNSKVGSQLVVTPWAGGSITIFINVTFMHQVRVHLIRVLRVSRHPKSRFKRLLELLVPWGIGDKHFFTWNTRGGFYLTTRIKERQLCEHLWNSVLITVWDKYHLCPL